MGTRIHFECLLFPEGKTDLLYKSVSPINTFRIIFNTYLNGKFELQDDKTYFSLFDVPYNFIDITSTVKNKCGLAPQGEYLENR